MHQPKAQMTNVLRHAEERIMLSTGRWCKYKCSYCYRGAKYSKIRQIPLDVVEQDLSYLEKMGYSDIVFYDDCFLTTNADRINDIVILMNKYSFRYHISVRFEMCSEEILKLISETKLSSIQIWLQSVNKDANKTSKRGFQEKNLKLSSNTWEINE